jgi:lysophospholipase L1-like esterase
MRDDSIEWDFSQFTPDVVTICLGQNDGIQDSAAFCSAYVGFINKIRGYYPRAEIICLSSPMADEHLLPVLKNYINSIASYVYREGDTRVRRFFFSRSFNNGCGGHPDIAQHQEMALELAAYIRKVMQW